MFILHQPHPGSGADPQARPAQSPACERRGRALSTPLRGPFEAAQHTSVDRPFWASACDCGFLHGTSLSPLPSLGEHVLVTLRGEAVSWSSWPGVLSQDAATRAPHRAPARHRPPGPTPPHCRSHACTSLDALGISPVLAISCSARP